MKPLFYRICINLPKIIIDAEEISKLMQKFVKIHILFSHNFA